MFRDYETPNFKTPPKKTILSSSSKFGLRSPFSASTTDEVSLEDVDMRVYEIVITALKTGHPAEKIDEIKEQAFKEIIKSNRFNQNYMEFMFFRSKNSDQSIVKGTRLVKIVQENLDEKISQKNTSLL